MAEIIAVALAYVVGSVPFAFLLSRRRGIDLRRVGSGNIGASNVLRTSGVSAAVVAMSLDAIKGALAVVLAQRVAAGPGVIMAAGLASVLGHVYPVWLKFRGGKGVATAAGVFAVLAPFAVMIACGVFLVAVWVTGFISVGSMLAAVTLAAAAWGTEVPGVVVAGAAVCAVVVLLRHLPNVSRLRSGTERRVGQRLF